MSRETSAEETLIVKRNFTREKLKTVLQNADARLAEKIVTLQQRTAVA